MISHSYRLESSIKPTEIPSGGFFESSTHRLSSHSFENEPDLPADVSAMYWSILQLTLTNTMKAAAWGRGGDEDREHDRIYS